VFVEQLPYLGISERLLPEGLGVVSGEVRIFKHAGDVYQQEKFLLLRRSLDGLPCFAEIDSGSVDAARLLAIFGDRTT